LKNFEIELTGSTPLLQHRMSQETILSLLGTKATKKKIKEEYTPRQIAEKHAYIDKGKFVIPTNYVRQAFKGAASDFKQTSSSRKSYKPIAAAIFRPLKEFALLTDEKNKPLTKFEVDIAKATNHRVGAVCVCRPRFDRWRTKFHAQIDTDLIDKATAQEILESAGRKVGIGSFRVSCGGHFGGFSVTRFKELRG